MRVTDKIIEDVTKEVVGDDAISVVRFLKNRKNISEFKIAEKIDREINEVRNILYRLHTHNLVTYHKKKDRQKGWYISYWTFNKKRVKDLLSNLKNDKISRYRQRLVKEEANLNNFFMCNSACIRLDFQSATEYEFKCPECGNLLNQQDNAKTIELLRKKIREIETAVA